MTKLKDAFLNYATLFTSVSTLLCCALPALLVSLGMGAVLAGLASNIPGLIWVSEHKTAVFITAGLLLAGNGFIIWRNRNAPCPIDPKQRDACITGRTFSKNIYLISLGIYTIGFFFAYVAILLP
jgi:hypothetical protein